MRVRCIGSMIVVAAWVVAGGSWTLADTQREAYDALGIPIEKVLVGTVLRGVVLPGDERQVVAVVTHFTGRKEKEDAIDVKLAVLREVGDRLEPIYERSFGGEHGGNVGRGELELFDFDIDGVQEIVVTYDDHNERPIETRRAEILLWTDEGFSPGWSGFMAYDATRDARRIPRERRDRYVREIDYQETLRTRGLTLFLNKKVLAVAGEPLAQPKTIQETFPLRPR